MPTREPIHVARVNERRQMNALGELAHERRALADGVMAFSPGVPWINHATHVGLASAVTREEIAELGAFYRERGVTPKIELTIFAPEEFLRALGSDGYFVEHFETVLARELSPETDPFRCMQGEPPGDLRIERTDPGDAERCREHSRFTAAGFMTEPIPEEMIAMGVRALRHPRSVAFMAFVGSEAVGACGMEVFECDGVRACALWGTTVAEPFRRRGVQQALIAHRLAHGIEHGCELAIIESKPGIATERNAARMGFALSYVRACMARCEGAGEGAQ